MEEWAREYGYKRGRKERTRKSKQSNKHWPTNGCHVFNNNTGSIATEAVLINS
jgi:hypothetical protein